MHQLLATNRSRVGRLDRRRYRWFSFDTIARQVLTTAAGMRTHDSYRWSCGSNWRLMQHQCTTAELMFNFMSFCHFGQCRDQSPEIFNSTANRIPHWHANCTTPACPAGPVHGSPEAVQAPPDGDRMWCMSACGAIWQRRAVGSGGPRCGLPLCCAPPGASVGLSHTAHSSGYQDAQLRAPLWRSRLPRSSAAVPAPAAACYLSALLCPARASLAAVCLLLLHCIYQPTS